MASRPNLLIADDEKNVTRTLQMIFEQEGYQVFPAYSAAEAIATLKNGVAIDAVIADLNMEAPDIGLKVAEAAGGLRPRPVVVICTGYANAQNSRSALELRVDYLIMKPADPAELTSTMERLLQRRSENLRRKEGTW